MIGKREPDKAINFIIEIWTKFSKYNLVSAGETINTPSGEMVQALRELKGWAQMYLA
jgi:hypothetical protein